MSDVLASAIVAAKRGELTTVELISHIMTHKVLLVGIYQDELFHPQTISNGNGSFILVFTSEEARLRLPVAQGTHAVLLDGIQVFKNITGEVGILFNLGSDAGFELLPSAVQAIKKGIRSN